MKSVPAAAMAMWFDESHLPGRRISSDAPSALRVATRVVPRPMVTLVMPTRENRAPRAVALEDDEQNGAFGRRAGGGVGYFVEGLIGGAQGHTT